MRTIITLYILPLILSCLFTKTVMAQQKAPGDTYQQAQAEMKSEQKREKKKRKKERKLEKAAGGSANDDAQHGWLFAKKRKKKMDRKEGEH
jgi:ABC-type microcin C transport system permease subunit YejB